MTRPIFEPTLTRKDAQLSYGQNQLFRRPAPGGGGVMRPWVWLHNGSQTIPNLTVLPINADDIQYDPALVTQGDVFDWNITDSGNPGVDRFELITRVEGFYDFSLNTVWNQVTTNGTQNFAYMQQRLRHMNTGETTTYYDNRASADWTKDTIGGTDPGEQRNNPYLNLDAVAYLGGIRVWKLTCIQTTGVDRTVGADVGLFVIYLGATDASEWTTESV